MNYSILTYSQWWELDGLLNRCLPENKDLTDFEASAAKAEENLKKLLQKVGREDEDWEVPTNYSSCPVLYAYIYNPKIITENILKEISFIIPKDKYSWYAELECYTEEYGSMSNLKIHKEQCLVCAEDEILWHINSLFGIPKLFIPFRKIHSKIVCFKHHRDVAKKLKQALEK